VRCQELGMQSGKVSDGALHDLRKEGDEEGESEERFFRLYTFPAYIQQISHGLERVK
jgi:hypothetical protein